MALEALQATSLRELLPSETGPLVDSRIIAPVYGSKFPNEPGPRTTFTVGQQWRRAVVSNGPSQIAHTLPSKWQPTFDGLRVIGAADPSESEKTLTFRDHALPDVLHVFNAIGPWEKAKLYHHEVNSRLNLLQSWEGVVTSVDLTSGEFAARLFDLTSPLADESEAVFDIGEVSTNDVDLLKVGSVFRWMIGYRKYNFGKQERISSIVFRRLPAWYESDIETAISYGEELAGTISTE